MADAARSRATYEDLRQVPDHLVAELLAGELHTSPRPAAPHALVSSVLGVELGGPFHLGRGGPGGWWIVDEPELHLGEDVLVPDLAGWRRERLPRWPDTPAIELCPDWICEILSPATRRLDRVLKLPRYAQHGVKHAWLIDPKAQILEALRATAEGWLLVATHAGDERPRAEPFEVVELDLRAWWGEQDDRG